jgi:plasmid maintenance system antidote protein VapI
MNIIKTNIHILRIYCLEKKMTIKKLAKDINISETQIHNIIKYKNIPSPKLALRIEEYTNHEIKAIDLLYPKNINKEDL